MYTTTYETVTTQNFPTENYRLWLHYSRPRKIIHILTESTSNKDTISKGALINFFTDLPWLETLEDMDRATSSNNLKGKRTICKVIFVGTNQELKNMEMSVCNETEATNNTYTSSEANWNLLINKRIDEYRVVATIEMTSKDKSTVTPTRESTSHNDETPITNNISHSTPTRDRPHINNTPSYKYPFDLWLEM